MHATYSCPVCDSHDLNLLHPLWQNRNSISSFKLHTDRYFASCRCCGVIFRFPLIIYEDTNVYGKEYYEVPDVDAGKYIEEHVAQHQKYNYENIVGLLREEFPPHRYQKWLDVGSVGYPTVFKDYSFDTVEPSQKAVEKGRQMFGSQRIYQGTIETFNPTCKYDGLLFNNSFYCLPAPRASLSRCRDLLSDEGVLVITLGTYLNGAIQDSGDGNVDRVEDFICGDTLHVYYNEFSLRYLLESAGFTFLGARKIAAYGFKNMFAYTFKKAVDLNAIKKSPTLLDQAKSYAEERLSSAFAGFERATNLCLDDIDRQDTILYGQLSLIRELNSIRKLSKIHGIIPTEIAVPAGMTLDGMTVTDINSLKSLMAKNTALRIVITSFTDARQLAAGLVAKLGNAGYEMYIPSRSSALESIYFEFGNNVRMSKAFKLVKMDTLGSGVAGNINDANSKSSEKNHSSIQRFPSGLAASVIRKMKRLFASLKA